MITKKRIARQICRCKEKLDYLENNKEHLSKHGYWEIGYLKGRITTLEDWLDELEELETEVQKHE